MTTTAIKQQLHSYLEEAGDEKIKAIYSMLETEINDAKVEYTGEFKAELNRRYAAYKNGTSIPVTAEQSKQRMRDLLNAAPK